MPILTHPPESGAELEARSSGDGMTMADMDAKLDHLYGAVLSASVYTANSWMVETLGEGSEIAPWRALNVTENDPMQLARALFLKATCKPLEGVGLASAGWVEDPEGAGQVEYGYRNGLFHYGDLATAALLERKDLDGATVVELSFRGTEATTTGWALKDALNTVGGYALGAYANLNGHYESYRMLIDEADRVINKRAEAGEKIRLHLSGHSLGASVAELCLKFDTIALRRPGSIVPVSATTFGSPGIGLPRSPFELLVHGCVKLLCRKLGLKEPVNVPVALSPELTQFKSAKDPVPKLGELGGYGAAAAATESVVLSPLDFEKNYIGREPVPGEVSIKVDAPLANAGWLGLGHHGMARYEKARIMEFARCARLFSIRKENSDLVSKVFSPLAALGAASDESHGMAVRLRESEPKSLLEFGAYARGFVKKIIAREGMSSKESPNAMADTLCALGALKEASARVLGKLAARALGGGGPPPGLSLRQPK